MKMTYYLNIKLHLDFKKLIAIIFFNNNIFIFLTFILMKIFSKKKKKKNYSINQKSFVIKI